MLSYLTGGSFSADSLSSEPLTAVISIVSEMLSTTYYESRTRIATSDLVPTKSGKRAAASLVTEWNVI